MNTFIRTSLILSAFFAFSTLATAEVIKITIAYSRLLLPVDRQGMSIPQAIIGGKVDFEGAAPAYVSLIIGGQTYTQPTDRLGYFSFLAYTANANSYNLEAWLPATESSTEPSPEIVKVNNALISAN
jgi:hypothetical protein